MEHTQIVDATELESYAGTRESEATIPELVWMLVKESLADDIAVCRIPYGSAINQPGWDGLVETANGFRQFVPKNKSFWEIGTGAKPQKKATSDFKTRTRSMSVSDREQASYVFVTPYGAGSGGWNEPAQSKWKKRRAKFSWRDIKILDAVQLADWLREFPAIGRWLLKKIGLVKSGAGFTTPAEHWENLLQLSGPGNPALPEKLFLVGRDLARNELERLFKGETRQLVLAVESELDAEDFVAAFLASLDHDTRRHFSNRCLFVKDADTWLSMANLKISHVLVAHPKLDLESSGEQLHMAATKHGHAVVIPVSGAWASGSNTLIPLRNPSASVIETTLTESGYHPDKARELAGAGALSLASLKRHLRGLGELPPYATWENARALAQAGLFGRWSGENAADKAALESALGKPYGEWIEKVRPETLRSDTPLTQRNENWKVISRGEAWSALGPHLTNLDLERFQTAAVAVLSEREPKLELPPDERYLGSVHGKVRQHSSSLRKGISETLALLGSRPRALSSCSQGKGESIAILTVRRLLENADWITWASLDTHLPLLAEAAPDEFLDAVETALLNPGESVFNTIFAQERPGVMGGNYLSGLLWALETLAWHPDYLSRVTSLLGDLASIDPGGNWSNRPGNSLTDIFLPWHPQTCATVEKRTAAIKALLREHEIIGWKLIMSLLPQTHGVTSGTRKPAWREFIPTNWSGTVSEREYWNQVRGYAELAVATAASDLSKLAELIDRLPDLPDRTYTRVLDHLASEAVTRLPEIERQPLWEALVDLAAQHRKFQDAQWAMPPEAITKVEEVATKLAPTSANLIYRRLFSDRDFDLFEEKGDYEQQRKNLNIRRQDAIKQIIATNGLMDVLDFARRAASPEKVGQALGSIGAESADTAFLPDLLLAEEKSLSAFIGGFVWGRFWARGWTWVDAVITDTWTIEQKTTFLTLLPFVHETWTRAETLLAGDAALYWKRANVNPWAPQEHAVDAVYKLLEYGRPRAALACLRRLVHDQVAFAPDLAVRALNEILTTEEPAVGLDQHAAQELIKWLQGNPASDAKALFQIEWSYLPLLDHHYGGAPRALERRMADDPGFFCEIIATVFRSDTDPKNDREPTDSESKMAQNAYRLLRGWRTVPGVRQDGSYDESAFTEWLDEVKRRTIESGHLRIAMNQIGEVLPFAPADPDGLWIHKSIASALNEKDAGEMRSGFTTKRFNMRGVHGYTHGEDERKLAAKFEEQANALEHGGYQRFATALRELANTYKRDAEHEATRNPFDD